MHPSVSNGISTGEDDLSLVLAAPLYRLGISIFVPRSARGTDPGEANPQALPGGALVGHSSTATAVDSARLLYTFNSTAIPAGPALAAARFDFTSGRQNQGGAHRYGQDTYVIRFATTPHGPLSTQEGRF